MTQLNLGSQVSNVINRRKRSNIRHFQTGTNNTEPRSKQGSLCQLNLGNDPKSEKLNLSFDSGARGGSDPFKVNQVTAGGRSYLSFCVTKPQT